MLQRVAERLRGWRVGHASAQSDPAPPPQIRRGAPDPSAARARRRPGPPVAAPEGGGRFPLPNSGNDFRARPSAGGRPGAGGGPGDPPPPEAKPAGKGPQRLVLVLAHNEDNSPVHPRIGRSKEVKQFRAGRQAPVPGSVQVVVVLARDSP